jgi:hypothetical protein
VLNRHYIGQVIIVAIVIIVITIIASALVEELEF